MPTHTEIYREVLKAKIQNAKDGFPFYEVAHQFIRIQFGWVTLSANPDDVVKRLHKIIDELADHMIDDILKDIPCEYVSSGGISIFNLWKNEFMIVADIGSSDSTCWKNEEMFRLYFREYER